MEPIRVKDATIVYSRGQEGYRQVVDSFKTAKWIDIVSYDIYFPNNYGLDELLKVPKNCRIRIVTNIPQKSTEEEREKVGKLYLQNLKPERFNNNTAVFFNFENHSKIIMTDTIAYVGSANFSSSNFHEFGLLFHDVEAINYLDKAVRDFCMASEGYYSNRLREDIKHLVDFSDIDNKMIEELIRLSEKADESRKRKRYPSTGIPGLINVADIKPEMNAEEKEIENYLYSLDMNKIKMVHYAMYLGRDYFLEDIENGDASIQSFFGEYNGISGWTDKQKEIDHVLHKSVKLSEYLRRGLMMLNLNK